MSPINRLPPWFRQDIPDDKALDLMHLFSEFGVHTVCQGAKCPNLGYCFRNKKVTFMILGETCTRNCKFCNIGTVLNPKQNRPRLAQEPSLISQVVKILGLRYVVITSVTRDDLEDRGARHFAKTIELIHGVNKEIKIEALIPDFRGRISSLECVLAARPFVVAHNIETVKRLYRDLRPDADYGLSLGILSRIKELKPEVITKSSIMLGLGETEQEVIETMQDLKNAECDILTLGQYLAPSARNYPVKEFISIEQFKKYQDTAKAFGFKSVLSGPLVRSSYLAEETSGELAYV